MLTKRTQILFDDELWEKLIRLARVRKTSIGSLVRQAVGEKYTQETEIQLRRKAIDDIKRIRPHLKGKIDYKALINNGRKY